MPNNKQTNNALPAGQKDPQLKSADDLAIDALSQSSAQSQSDQPETEAEKSDEFAQTLHSLESVIESKANKLMQMKQEAREKREMISNVFENDTQLAEVEEQKQEVQTQLKQRKTDLNETVQVRQLKDDLREIKQEQKDLEESLSNHLINYHQLTNSTSFDTSDGDQWEFDIKAKVKSKKTKN
jgi:chromosome segregation ATPase